MNFMIVKKHIVSPRPIWDKEKMKKQKSNIVPSDFDNWEKNFINAHRYCRLWSWKYSFSF